MPYLTVKQAAENLDVSEKTIRNWIDQGILKAFQPAPRCTIRIQERDIERLTQ